MNFGFTAEQDILRSGARKFLDENAPMERVRKIVESDDGFDRGLWRRMGEMGWIGLALPEELGGAGADLVTLVVVLEETGRTLFPSPLVSTVLAGDAIEGGGNEEQRQRWLPSIADGSRIATLAFLEEEDRHDPDGVKLTAERRGEGFALAGRKLFVPDAGVADLFVVAFRSGGELRLGVIERAARGVTVVAHPSLDPTKRVGTVSFDGAVIPEADVLAAPQGGERLFERLLDVGAMLVTAEAIGAAEGALRLTTEYARTRVQFGSAIGRFQGVKHPLAEAYVDIESFKSLLYYAAWALDHDAVDAPLAVSRAKAYAAECFPRQGVDAVQLHGGIGYTWEYDAQLYLKRSKWFRPAFGDAEHHYERIVALGGI